MEAVKSKQVKLKSYTIICQRQISVTFYTWENFSVLRFLLSLLSLNPQLISFDCVMESDIEIKMHHQYT